MTILIPNLALGGYRSFGKQVQFFERFAKINLFIGQNNAGKSNVLRFLYEMYPQLNGREAVQFDALAKHLPDHPPIIAGIGEQLDMKDPHGPRLPDDHRLLGRLQHETQKPTALHLLGKLFFEKAKIDGTTLCWTLLTLPDREAQRQSWLQATKVLRDHELQQLWAMLTNMNGGDRAHSWEPQVVKLVPGVPASFQAQMIPAIRKIGDLGSTSEGFDGTGIIDRVAKLQNPDVYNQTSRLRFNAIRDFLRDVLDRPDATIEVPYPRDTILVHMDNKVLPIESLGSGIHEVLILASAATVLEGQVVCIEEPELHLNPILQRKFIRYLDRHTTNQYFISTHSAALMDTPNAEIYHIRLNDGASFVERATTSEHRSAVCEDLGYHPSDLLQANCILWVEGPSDRIYLNWWIQSIAPELLEGIHYSIMFYGGRLAAHLSNAPDGPEVEDFISLRRLNRRGVMLIDSDRDKPQRPINSTKRRLQREFDLGPGHAWITEGREIENYVRPEHVRSAIAKIHPTAKSLSPMGRYDNMLQMKSGGGKDTMASKVEVAKYVCQNYQPDFGVLDLRRRIQLIALFISASNPNVGPSFVADMHPTAG